jgi:hypothetical protein
MWSLLCYFVWFVGPCSHRDRDYRIRSNFWKFYLMRTGFTLGEPVSLVKLFRLSKLEQMFFWCSECVDTVGRCTTSYLLARPACLWRLVFVLHPKLYWCCAIITTINLPPRHPPCLTWKLHLFFHLYFQLHDKSQFSYYPPSHLTNLFSCLQRGIYKLSIYIYNFF